MLDTYSVQLVSIYLIYILSYTLTFAASIKAGYTCTYVTSGDAIGIATHQTDTLQSTLDIRINQSPTVVLIHPIYNYHSITNYS